MKPNENELYHHGIKGQKWGVRRTPEQLGYRHATKNSKKKDRLKNIKDDASKKVTNGLNKLNNFKNDVREKVQNELQREINRINSEMTLKRLASDDILKATVRRNVKLSTAMKVQNYLANPIFDKTLQTNLRDVSDDVLSDTLLKFYLGRR